MKKDNEDLKATIESILFAAGKSVSFQELEKITKTKEERIKAVAKDLEKDYENKKSSLRVIMDNNAIKLTVRDQYLPVVENIVTETELPKSVMETLAVIAFKHPILQADLVKIRSNKCYDHLAQLEEANFIRRERTGRTKKIHLTQKFFDYFELPPNKVKEAFSSFEAVSHAIEEKEKEVEQKLEEYENEQKKKVKEAKQKNQDRKDESAEMFDGKLEDMDTDFEQDDNFSPSKVEVYDVNTIPDGEIEIINPEDIHPKKENKGDMINREILGKEDDNVDSESDTVKDSKKELDYNEEEICIDEEKFNNDRSLNNDYNENTGLDNNPENAQFTEDDLKKDSLVTNIDPNNSSGTDSTYPDFQDSEEDSQIDYMKEDFDPDIDLKGMPKEKKAEIMLKRKIELRANNFLDLKENEDNSSTNDDDSDNKNSFDKELDNIAKEIQEQKDELQN